MSEWQDIDTAPKDGTVILGYDPEGVPVPSHVYTWPDDAELYIIPVRWHSPNSRTSECAGWYAPMVDSGSWPGEGTDYYECEVRPTHWMPLPEPPK